ncbi:2-aminoethanethiol dioxygenase-like [Clytia hemisphaerica]|uniref:2-aminoethanethiol dioxygenase n=1 Tax=Clytia hemisphaerica TaxID=252671 RepID=A0A7M5UM87_9CNID|eukprot:TCONS_00058215-protein
MCIVKQVAKQALNTFKFTESSLFPSQFEKLLTLAEKIKETDVGLDSELKEQTSDAPVTFINIYEGSIFTLGIFIIRKGHSLPLHDHPGMFGVCKPLFGTLHVKSYQRLEERHPQDSSFKNLLAVKKLPEKLVKAESVDQCQVLTPMLGNFHTISAVREDAAIFDILSPPYTNGRDCSYYRELSTEEQKSYGIDLSSEERSNGLTFLKQIPPPASFYCDSKEYKGPIIDLDE